MTKTRIAGALLLGASLLLGPVSARAGERQHRDDITITKDGQFNPAHGVRSGRGTHADPYVISGWTVGNITIADTSKAVRIRDNTIHGTLTLNWAGSDVIVHRNDVGDLRVNENVKRTGAPTAGIIDYNRFGLVSQIRHFDGMFVHNTVGSPNNFSLFSGPAVNFDGFNGGHLSHNTIYGYVDARLHGHHHSSAYGTGSHMHAGMGGMVDHYHRYHEVFIEQNRIVTENWYGLAYLDTDHAANDRTAASETNPILATPHAHFTRAHIRDNVLEGSGIMVNVFNAPDKLHKRWASGSMDIIGNRITLARGLFWPFQTMYGIQVSQAQRLALRIDRNTIVAPAPDLDAEGWARDLQAQGAGISLQGLDRATVMLGRDSVTNLAYGIQAFDMTRGVDWTIAHLSTRGVTTPVYYDSSVKNRPRQR